MLKSEKNEYNLLKCIYKIFQILEFFGNLYFFLFNIDDGMDLNSRHMLYCYTLNRSNQVFQASLKSTMNCIKDEILENKELYIIIYTRLAMFHLHFCIIVVTIIRSIRT